MGQGMGAILLSFLVIAGDHGPGAVGLCIAAGLLPVALGAGVASRRAERHDRRALLVGSQALLAAVALALALTGEPALAAIAAAALVSGLARVAFDATALSVLHHLVDADRLPAAARDLTTRFHVGHVCGAGVVSALLPVADAPRLFLPCALAFAAGAAVSSRHHPDIDLRPGGRPRLDRALAEGRRALMREPRLRPLAIATGAAGACAAGAATLVVPFLRHDLRLGGDIAVVFLAAVAALAATMAVLPRLVATVPWRTLAASALAAHPIAIAMLGLAGSASAAAAGYGALLAAGAVLGVAINHRRIHAVPDELRVPVSLAGGVLSARAGAAGALAVGAASVPLGEQRAYLALALAAALAGAAAYLAARPGPLRRPA